MDQASTGGSRQRLRVLEQGGRAVPMPNATRAQDGSLPEIVVSVRDVGVVLGGQPVLEDISLEIVGGTFLGIVGPNGAGKTTLLKTILGLIQPTAGEVRVFGFPPRCARRHAALVGYVPQRSTLEWDFPVSTLDVVLMGRYAAIGIGRRPGREDRAAAVEALRWMGIAEYAEARFSTLSGGQQKRALVARALSTGPRLLILDEPMSGVDIEGQSGFYRLLTDLKGRLGLTVILVSHDVSLVPTYCDEVACLDRTLFLHGKPTGEEVAALFEKVHGCEVELFMHGRVPHRVMRHHEEPPDA
jgi:zinc transport system ATP-binding protein